MIRNQVPEWSSNYLSYKELKKLIKEINAQRLSRTPVLGPDDPDQRKRALHPATDSDLAKFFYALDRNLDTVEWFYQSKYSEYSRRLKHVHDRYPVSTLKPEELDHEELEDLIGVLLDIRSQLRKLQWYAELNKRGFVKILKKFDKKVETTTKTRYLESKVLVSSFANGASLDERLLLTNKYLGELTPYAAHARAEAADAMSTEKLVQANGLELRRISSRGSSTSSVGGGVSSTVNDMRNAVATDNVSELKKHIEELMSNPDLSTSAFNKSLLSVLSRAVNARASDSTDLLLWYLPSLNDRTEINGRNIIHRIVINQGRQLFGDVGRENRIEKNYLNPAEAPKHWATPGEEVGELNPEAEIGTFSTLLDRLQPHHRIAILSRDQYGQTPLHYAAYYGLKATTRVILERMKQWGYIFGEVNFDSPVWQDNEGATPMKLAVSGNHPKTTAVMIEFSTVKLRDESGLLLIAANHGSPELLGALLKGGLNIDYYSEPEHETALFIAAKMNHTEAVKFLLELGADTEIGESTYGWTPVFVAAVDGYMETTKALIEGGSDIEGTDESGWTAKEHACLRGHLKLADVLEQAKQSSEYSARRSRSPLRRSLSPGSSQIHSLSPPPLSGSSSRSLSASRPPTAVTSSKMLSVEKLNNGRPPKVPPSTEAGADTIIKTFGHRYLQDKTMILVTLGSTDLRNHTNPVQLDRVPFSRAHTTQLDTALSLVVSASDSQDSSVVVDLPMSDNQASDPISFFVDDISNVRLYFDLVPTYSGHKKKVLGRAVALVQNIYSTLGEKKRSLHQTLTLPIVEAETMDVLGSIQFGFLIVTPFHHANMGIEKSTTYWKSLINTRVIGHRGLGKNSTSKNSLQLGENTIESFVQAANLGASYVEFDVQLTKDHVPVIYHDFLVSETGIDIPVHAMTLDQFLHVSKMQELNDPDKRPHHRRGGSPPPSYRPRSSSMYEVEKKEPGEDEHPHMKQRMQFTRDYRAKGFKGNYRGHSIQSPFTTLEQVFKNLPKNVGFNIECKYPMVDESENEEMELLGFELNTWVDTVLKCVYDHGDGRDIIFSSFHPDVCMMLSLKQPSIPVLYLTEGGTEFMADVRASSLQEAIRFAKRWDLLGIVSSARPLIQCPRLVNVVKESGLVCVTYGTDNNDPDNARLQMKSGVDAVIVDSVLAIRKGLTADDQ